MSRKDFERIAAILKECKADKFLIVRMAEYLSTQNSAFDTEKFFTAAGYWNASKEEVPPENLTCPKNCPICSD